MNFKILGTKITISFWFALTVAVMVLFDKSGFILPMLVSVIIHELGHLAAMWILKVNPTEVNLIPASVRVVRSFNCKPSSEIIIQLCGPIINLVLFFMFYVNYVYFGIPKLMDFAAVNLVVAAFNLLPVIGLDGGNIMSTILKRFLPENRVIIIMRTVTAVTAAAFVAIGIFLAISGKANLSFFIIAAYLITSALIKM